MYVVVFPFGRTVVITITSLTRLPGGVYVKTTVLPFAFVVVITWPGRVPESTTVTPFLSVVVSGMTTVPPAILAVDSVDVLVIVFPLAFVVFTRVAGASTLEVIVSPFELVVVIRVVMVVCAVDWSADVVFVTVLPPLFVEVNVTGTKIPVVTGTELLMIEVTIDGKLRSAELEWKTKEVKFDMHDHFQPTLSRLRDENLHIVRVGSTCVWPALVVVDTEDARLALMSSIVVMLRWGVSPARSS